MEPIAIPFELKALFLRELDEGLGPARQAFARLGQAPSDEDALHLLGGYFHRIAGTAHSVGYPTLGRLGMVCEGLAAHLKSCEPKDRPGAIATFEDALLAVDELLEEHRVPAQPRADARRTSEPVLPHVLVVDSDPFSAGLVDGCLRAAGFVSACCSDPQGALGLIEADLPDLILLDVAMPGLDGFELCRRIRRHPALAFTPVIFATRQGDTEQRLRGLEVGGSDSIGKPFDPQELVARVRFHLQRVSALQDLALRDGLTRCFNHKHYRQRLGQELARARRYPAALSVALVDADRFQALNDTWGRPAGDAALVHLADLVAAGVRSTDVVARCGGEQFGLLLVEAGGKEAEIVTSRLRARVAGEPFVLPEPREGAEAPRVSLTVSIGVAEAAADDSVPTLLQRAEGALREAQRNGDCVCVAGRP